MNTGLKMWGNVVCAFLLMVGCGTSDETSADSSSESSVLLDSAVLDVNIPVSGLNLEGVLHLPERVEGEPVSGIVLVHGSGANSRDHVAGLQFNMYFRGVEVMAFSDIAQALQTAGYAVLRYDKRNCGTFNELCTNSYPVPQTDITVTDFMDDAVAAVQWLIANTAVDADKVFVAGLSQGGEMMPAILDAEPGLAGGVSLAGNWRPVDELLRYQLDFSRQLLEGIGMTATQIDTQLSSLIEWVEGMESIRGGTFESSALLGVPVGFWQSWMDIGDARPGLVAAETRPMLAINGDYDWNVPADPELGLWAAAGVETVLIECMTHALNCVTSSNWQALPLEDIGTEVHPELLTTMIDWLDIQTLESQE